MPELPEVETVVRTLRPKLVGSRINSVQLNRTDILLPSGFDLAGHLIGRRVEALSRRGKRIVFDLDDGNRFYVHLGMTGQLTVERIGSLQVIHTHFILTTDKTDVRFRDPRRFGGIWWLGTESADINMGPEPLDLPPTRLAQQLAGTRRAIKSALLDQSVVAGLGNIYVDESLFTAAIHPEQPANTLEMEQIHRLNRAIKQTLRQAIAHRGSTLRDYMDADGAAGGFQDRHRVYDQTGKPCRVCKTPIERIVLGGRSTHFCGKCQRRG